MFENLRNLAPRGLQQFVLNHRLAFIRVWQSAVIGLSLFLAFLLRFDFAIPPADTQRMEIGIGIALATKMIAFYFLDVEHGWWQFAGVADLVKIFTANSAGSTLFTLVTFVSIGTHFPRSVYLIDFLLCFFATAGARFCVRLYHEIVLREVAEKSKTKGLLIYGAGVAGLNLV